MGDFSRNTFQLMNVMHQVDTGNLVADPRHYVSVRARQGMPVMDADENEDRDIQRISRRLHLKHFFGDGIPSGDRGFEIGPVTVDNDFSIGAGIALVSGELAVNVVADLTYLGQLAALGITPDPLTPPLTGERDDLVYLDCWEEEIRSSGAGRPDGRIVHPAVGIETATRFERRWSVRVAPGVESIDDVAAEAGHAYLELALLHRVDIETQIGGHRITDLRRTDLNVAKHLKIPVHATRGAIVVDSRRMAELLDTLRTILMTRFENNQLHFTAATDPERTLILLALQHVFQLCSAGALQARTRNLDNADALEVLRSLESGQRDFAAALAAHGDAGAPRDDFVTEYGTRLDTLSDEATDEDLVDAYSAQQGINSWLATVVDGLPEGSASLQFTAVAPGGGLVAGTPYTFTVEFRSDVVSTSSTEEVFDITAGLSSALWSVVPSTAEITLANGGGTDAMDFVVTPNAGNVEATLLVTAEARRNPSLVRTTHPGILLRIGEIPPVGAILSYAGPPLNVGGAMELTLAQITFPFGGVPINYALANRTLAVHTYTLEWFVELPPGDDDSAWVPNSGAVQSNDFIIADNTIGMAALHIKAPNTIAAGQTGIMHVTLTQIDGTPLAGPDRETVNMDFVVIP